jgi:hypothetical protein
MDTAYSERSPADLVLFALGFLGFILAATGVVVASRGLTTVGGLLFLFTVWLFRLKAAPAE